MEDIIISEEKKQKIHLCPVLRPLLVYSPSGSEMMNPAFSSDGVGVVVVLVVDWFSSPCTVRWDYIIKIYNRLENDFVTLAISN